MAPLSFGQPDDGIIQIGYVVPELREAMRHWTDQLRVGPWFVVENFAGEDPTYRGVPAEARCDIALGFAGHMQIELICQRDDKPSVYREMVAERGYGFHHFGVAAGDFEAEARRLRAKGYVTAFTARVPSGGRVAYFDTRGAMPGMIELIEADAGLDAMFGDMYRQSLGWAGEDPIRVMHP